MAGYLWAWFIELHDARPASGAGVSPITYSEISAWSDLTMAVPTPWEVSVIKKIDKAYLLSMIKGQRH